MAESATILIPDISGYTDFVTRTELDHGAIIINHLLETIVKAASSDFVVSEIEGDAVLLYKKGEPPNKKEIVDQCVNIFTSFHNDIRHMWGVTLCQCGACQGLDHLTLKFVVHYGSIAEIKVAQFTKASGVDMVIAHRLLKNNIPEHEYLLATDNYLKNTPDSEHPHDLNWTNAKEEYPSIGVIKFRFASLTPIKNSISPMQINPMITTHTHEAETMEEEIVIEASFLDVEEALMDMRERKRFVEGLRDVVGTEWMFTGAQYRCIFDEGPVVIEAVQLNISESEIYYEESASSPEANYFALFKFRITSLGDEQSKVALSMVPQAGHSFSSEQNKTISARRSALLKNLKHHMENYWQENKYNRPASKHHH